MPTSEVMLVTPVLHLGNAGVDVVAARFLKFDLDFIWGVWVHIGVFFYFTSLFILPFRFSHIFIISIVLHSFVYAVLCPITFCGPIQ